MDDEDNLLGGGLVFAAACWAMVAVMGAIDGVRFVRGRADCARAALQRWPLPRTLGTLTNAQIDEHLRRA